MRCLKQKSKCIWKQYLGMNEVWRYECDRNRKQNNEDLRLAEKFEKDRTRTEVITQPELKHRLFNCLDYWGRGTDLF